MIRRRPLLTLGGAFALAAWRLTAARRASPLPAEVRIVDPGKAVKVEPTGPASSAQEAEVVVPRDFLERVWTPDSLELLARGYWAFLRRATLGLTQIRYALDSRTVTALGVIPLLRFGAPRYETSEERGQVTWPIAEGLLVSREGRGKGHLRVAVRRCDRDGVDDEADRKLDRVRLIARVEVENFYPGLRGSGAFARLGAWIYAQTQLRIHVVVCNGFLRSLPRLEFPALDTSSMPSERAAPVAERSTR